MFFQLQVIKPAWSMPLQSRIKIFDLFGETRGKDKTSSFIQAHAPPLQLWHCLHLHQYSKCFHDGDICNTNCTSNQTLPTIWFRFPYQKGLHICAQYGSKKSHLETSPCSHCFTYNRLVLHRASHSKIRAPIQKICSILQHENVSLPRKN